MIHNPNAWEMLQFRINRPWLMPHAASVADLAHSGITRFRDRSQRPLYVILGRVIRDIPVPQ